MFSQFLAKIGIKVIVSVLVTLLTLGIPLYKSWKENKENENKLSQMQQKMNDLEEEMRLSNHATLHFGNMQNILELGLVKVEISGTKFIKKPIQDEIVKRWFFSDYRDYYIDVATFSFDAKYSVDLNKVFIKETPEKIVVYGLEVAGPDRSKETWNSEYTTVIRYATKKIDGKEVVDEAKYEDVLSKYRDKGFEFIKLNNEAKEEFFNRCDNGHEMGYVSKIVLENAENFFKSLFALQDPNKKVEFDYKNKPSQGAINFKELK